MTSDEIYAEAAKCGMFYGPILCSLAGFVAEQEAHDKLLREFDERYASLKKEADDTKTEYWMAVQ